MNLRLRSVIFLFATFLFIKQNSAISDEQKDKAKIRISIGGEVDAQFGALKQSEAYTKTLLPNAENTTSPAATTKNQANGGFSGRVRANAVLNVTVKTKLFKYGTSATLQTGNIEDDYAQYGRETFVFLQHMFGKVEMGSVYSSAARMRVDATNIARATGGIQGDWFRYVAMPTYNTSGMSSADANEAVIGFNPVFMLQPMLPNEAGFSTGTSNGNYIYGGSSVLYQNNVQPRLGWGSLANKISYYTPRIYGFQVGLSYAPDTGMSGAFLNTNSSYAKDYLGHSMSLYGRGITGDVRNLFTFGVNFMKEFGKFSLAGSITHEAGQYEGMGYAANGIIYSGFGDRKDLSATAYGIKLSYDRFSIAYSFGDWGKSLYAKQFNYYSSNGEAILSRSFYHTAGISASYGIMNLSLTYMYSNNRGNILNLVSLGSDLRLGGLYGRGFVPYVELTFYDMSPAYAKLSSGNFVKATPLSGYVFLCGLKVIF